VLTAEQRRVERVLLELRLTSGCPLDLLTPAGAAGATRALADGLLEPAPYAAGRAVLTLRGRLLADAVARALTD
jgi:oxygen-independent coproporphyrinogen-3 oxidase